MQKWQSPKRRQKRVKIWLQNGTKNNNTSSHMLLDHCYAFGLSLYIDFRSEEEVSWRTVTPWHVFATPWIRPWVDLAEKQQHFVRDH